MHGMSQIIDSTSQPVKTNKYCAAGFLISTATDINSEDDPFIHKTEQEDAQERGWMMTSNCHSSLQLINIPDPKPIVTDNSTPYESFVLLASSQSFIFEIADPPRL